MYSPWKSGRLKTRLHNKSRREAYMAAEHEASNNLLPDLKKFLNELPLQDRIRAAWRIILGRF